MFTVLVLILFQSLIPEGPRENPMDRQVYVYLPPGTFQMGCSPRDEQCSSRERPAHEVQITRGFWMARTEATLAAYEEFSATTGAPGSDQPGPRRRPFVGVSWVLADAVCKWSGGRLPTEAEWEYAARAGNTRARYDDIDEIAWTKDNSGKTFHEAGQKKPNNFGLYDMIGNVWEWTADWYADNYYEDSPRIDPAGPAAGDKRSLRGGSWYDDAGNARASFRGFDDPAAGFSSVGFRCVRDSMP